MADLLHPGDTEMAFVTLTVARLSLAALLGGLIGLERELRHKPAGLRTNMFICIGAAMFTVISFRMASDYPGDHTRIAAQIIPGIGFIGAGSILHSRGSISGLTTAATLFVVASIGMGVGAGEYLPAVFATVLILFCLLLLAVVETRFNLKPLIVTYEAVGGDADAMIGDINQILEEERHSMQTVHVGRIDHEYRVQFNVDATRSEHETLLKRLRQCGSASRISSLGAPPEHE